MFQRTINCTVHNKQLTQRGSHGLVDIVKQVVLPGVLSLISTKVLFSKDTRAHPLDQPLDSAFSEARVTNKLWLNKLSELEQSELV